MGQEGHFVIPKLVNHFKRRALHIELGNLNVEREFNDVRPVSDTYVKLLDQGVAGQTYNICSGEPVSLSQVISTLEEISQHSMEVSVNPAFVRANEVFRLCGDPTRVEACVGPIPHVPLRDTLQWMLQAAAGG